MFLIHSILKDERSPVADSRKISSVAAAVVERAEVVVVMLGTAVVVLLLPLVVSALALLLPVVALGPDVVGGLVSGGLVSGGLLPGTVEVLPPGTTFTSAFFCTATETPKRGGCGTSGANPARATMLLDIDEELVVPAKNVWCNGCFFARLFPP
jgi:hypothetical protein